ncbi:DUF6247 family protein [Streptomyces sp. NPDC042319]|uniref:DUF6247 family protein n=1 Tax=Streptomyces sp. NPDC042319 TaxID=3154332 RepID=UPI00340C3480
MSAQPQHAPAPTPAPTPAPAPAPAAELLAHIRADRRADRWVPAFERDWAGALEDSRHSYSLTPLHDVVRTWQARRKAAPARRRLPRLRHGRLRRRPLRIRRGRRAPPVRNAGSARLSPQAQAERDSLPDMLA